MYNAMYMRDGCENIDLSLNSLVGGEDQFGEIRSADFGCSLSRASENFFPWRHSEGGRMDVRGGSFIRWSTVPPIAAVGLAAVVSVVVPGRVAVVLPLLLTAPLLLVVFLILLLSPGLLLLEVLLGSLKVSLLGGRSICCGCRPSADCVSRNLESHS